MKIEAMKKKTAILFAALLAVTLAASSAASVPSLFHNDEAWYRDSAAPLVCRDDTYYIPADLFEQLSGIRVSEPSEDALLIYDTESGDYVSVLVDKRRAAVNGRLMEEVGVFREDNVVYVDVMWVAESIGVAVETVAHEDGGISVRLTDGNELLTTERLVASYLPQETVTDEFAGWVEEESLDLKRIFVLCREPSESDGTSVSALELLQSYDMGYTLFLSEDTSDTALLSALAGGEYGIITDEYGSAEETVAALDKMNERFGVMTHYRTHFTIASDSVEVNEALARADYCTVTPDFTVDGSVDADIMFADMLQHLGRNTYCFLLLEDCPQTARLLELINKIDREQFVTSNLGH